MQNTDLISLFIAPLHQENIPYMVTGSVAGMMYGEPRLTNDIDVVVLLKETMLSRISSRFPSPDYYCPPEEVIRLECLRTTRGHFNIIHMDSGSKADVYLAGSALHQWGMEHRRLIQVDGQDVWIAPPEYVIIRKLEFHREGGSEKHLLDIKAMLEISGELIDHTVMEQWVTTLGLGSEWRLVRPE